MNPSSKNFCISPFSEVRIDPDGRIRFCHAADRSFIPKSDNLSNFSIDEYFNHSETVFGARNKLLNGEFLSACEGCYNTEKNNSVSFRQRRNMQAAIFPDKDFVPSFNESINRIKKITKPKFYCINLSNLCNMGCMMCSGQFSNIVSKTHTRSGITGNDGEHLQDWTTNREAWDLFCEHLLSNEQITCLHIMGGEPLYHKKFYELVDFLIRNNHTNFHFTFVTNGSVYSPELIKKLKKFKSLQIEISVETTKNSNDYIRYPSNTGKIVDNIKSFCQSRDKFTDVIIRTVPQLLSMYDYESILNLALESSVVLDSNFLHEPSFLKPNLMLDSQKNEIYHKLQKFIIKDTNIINLRDKSDIKFRVSENAQRVINAINEPCSDIETQRKQFIEYCAKIDATRKIDVRDYVPELELLFNHYNYESARYNSKHKFTIYKRD